MYDTSNGVTGFAGPGTGSGWRSRSGGRTVSPRSPAPPRFDRARVGATSMIRKVINRLSNQKTHISTGRSRWAARRRRARIETVRSGARAGRRGAGAGRRSPRVRPETPPDYGRSGGRSRKFGGIGGRTVGLWADVPSVFPCISGRRQYRSPERWRFVSSSARAPAPDLSASASSRRRSEAVASPRIPADEGRPSTIYNLYIIEVFLMLSGDKGHVCPAPDAASGTVRRRGPAGSPSRFASLGARRRRSPLCPSRRRSRPLGAHVPGPGFDVPRLAGVPRARVRTGTTREYRLRTARRSPAPARERQPRVSPESNHGATSRSRTCRSC